jgi:cytosine/adenosine deaminase-related metal-dependent hydrolase
VADELLLRNVRPFGAPARDVLAVAGRIAETGDGLAAPRGATVVDGRGHLAFPGLVAFPQSGLLVRPGTAELLEAAVRAGAELVGGLDPAGFDHQPVEHLDAIFAIAGRHGCGLDIHLHDGGELRFPSRGWTAWSRPWPTSASR